MNTKQISKFTKLLERKTSMLHAWSIGFHDVFEQGGSLQFGVTFNDKHKNEAYDSGANAAEFISKVIENARVRFDNGRRT